MPADNALWRHLGYEPGDHVPKRLTDAFEEAAMQHAEEVRAKAAKANPRAPESVRLTVINTMSNGTRHIYALSRPEIAEVSWERPPRTFGDNGWMRSVPGPIAILRLNATGGVTEPTTEDLSYG